MLVALAGNLLLWATLFFIAGIDFCSADDFIENCTRGFYLYDTVHQRPLAFYETSYLLNFFDGSGTINLAQLQNVSTSLSLVIDFCLSDLNSVLFNVYAKGGSQWYQQYQQYAINATRSPFSTGGILANGKLRPTPWLNAPGNYFISAHGKGPNYDIYQTVTIGIFWPQAGNITSVTLVDVDANNKELQTVFVGDSVVFDLAQYPTNHTFTAVAKVVGSVSSVKFTMLPAPPPTTNTLYSLVDSTAPFTMGGDLRGRYTGVKLLSLPGSYHLRAAPFTGTNAKGFPGLSYWCNLQILPTYRIENFTIVDLSSGAVEDRMPATTPPTPFPDFYYLDVLPYNGTNVTIRANVVGNVGSVRFKLYRYRSVTVYQGREITSTHFSNPVQVLNKVVNRSPFHLFALGGLTTAGKYQPVNAFKAGGVFQLQAIAYPLANQQGTAQPPLKIYFGVKPLPRAIPIFNVSW